MKNIPFAASYNVFSSFFCSMICTIFCCVFFTACATDPPSGKTMAKTDFQYDSDSITKAEVALLRDGDVVLRAGNGMVSEHIMSVLQEPIRLSHCGIFYHTPQGDSVISSESGSLQDKEGVQAEPLWLFLHDAQPNSFMAVRPHGTAQQAKEVVARAKYYLAQNILFDYAFDIKDEHFFYCAELLQHVLLDVYKKDILNETLGDEKPVLRMRQFYDPEKFDIIIKHPK